MLDIARKNNPRFKEEYGLPTNALKKLVESWMDGVIALAPLKKGSVDDHWLISCRPYSDKDMQALCGMIGVWVNATYAKAVRTSQLVKGLVEKFCEQIAPQALAPLQSQAEVRLTLKDGTVSEEAYQALPLLAINHLLGKEIPLQSETLRLCYAAKNQLVSQPLKDPKSGHAYSFVFDFSVQTTPPQRKALLLCQMSMRRWVPDALHKDSAPVLKEHIHAHIKAGEYKYCQVQIACDNRAQKVDWKEQDKTCYNIWGYEPLPDVQAVLADPAACSDRVLLPYKNGMWGVKSSKIGTGVSVRDKASLYGVILGLLQERGIAGAPPEAERVTLRGQKFPVLDDPKEYKEREDFRRWVKTCAETGEIQFELYGLWKDPVQQNILEKLQKKIEQDFGPNSPESCLQIHCTGKEVGSLADAMPDDSRATKIKHRDEIAAALGKTETVTACIFVLPGAERYAKGDLKLVLRNAFAHTGRVVQFINPEEENDDKIDNTVYDLYRQLGVVTLLDPAKKLPPLAGTPCIGMHLCTQVQGIANKARFLPIYVTVNIPAGKTRVECDAFSERSVSYREACLEMAKLFWDDQLEQRCVEASRVPAKQKLMGLKNQYRSKEDGVLLIVQADGNTRAVWSGISDKEIGGYETAAPYCPEKINVGMPKSPYMLSLLDSGVRVMRIRGNQEVPDYYTEISEKSTEEREQRASASGIFRYGEVYWGIHARPNDPQYTKSFRESKIEYPGHRFAEKDMLELYPMQLQPGDKAEEWVFCANALRHIPIQYNQSLVLPLPLHLAQKLEEYLFEG